MRSTLPSLAPYIPVRVLTERAPAVCSAEGTLVRALVAPFLDGRARRPRRRGAQATSSSSSSGYENRRAGRAGRGVRDAAAAGGRDWYVALFLVTGNLHMGGVCRCWCLFSGRLLPWRETSRGRLTDVKCFPSLRSRDHAHQGRALPDPATATSPIIKTSARAARDRNRRRRRRRPILLLLQFRTSPFPASEALNLLL